MNNQYYDYIIFALKSFKSRKLRTFLTMLGIFVGIAAVVSLVSLGQGLQKAITEQFESLGANKLMITPKGGFYGMGSSVVLDKDDLKVVKHARGIRNAGGFVSKVASVEFGDERKYTWVSGLPQDDSKEIISDISSFKIAEGRDLKKGDDYRVLAGSLIAKGDFFDKKVRVGDKIKVENKKFEIVGILEPIGNPQDDSSFIATLDSAVNLFGGKEKYATIMAAVVEGEEPSKVAESLKRTLRRHRGVDEGEEDFSIQTFEEVLDSFSSIFLIVQSVLIGIAGISLLVGGIGIMNTMYTSVFQRTNEIGTMKAIGARNSDILKIFLIESGFLGMVGGAVGILIGVIIGKAVEFGAAQSGLDIFKASFPWYLILGSLAFSFIVGSVAGVFPALQASKLKPIEALRYE
ncbi:FtsX-like permease family protein [Candidatus Woesearchaeota archaeon]|nr:FtsX-like permease family protein [Candidatus Woesearchaeota archaeon]